MTHSAHTPASPHTPHPHGRTTLPAGGFTGRARRARTDPMLVRALRDDRYVVETNHGTYVVDLDGRSCTCPDHAIRGSRCKHLRRVAIDVTDGRVPPPGKRRAICAVCGDRMFVPVGDTGAHLCDKHAFEPGEFARDRETGSMLVVVAATALRADEYETAEGRPIADYETNADYGDHEPVVEAAYIESLRNRDSVADLSDVKRYGFPASRLHRLGRSHPRVAADIADIADIAQA